MSKPLQGQFSILFSQSVHSLHKNLTWRCIYLYQYSISVLPQVFSLMVSGQGHQLTHAFTDTHDPSVIREGIQELVFFSNSVAKCTWWNATPSCTHHHSWPIKLNSSLSNSNAECARCATGHLGAMQEGPNITHKNCIHERIKKNKIK